MATNKAKYPSPLAQPWRVRACAPTQPVASFPCTSFSFCLEDWVCQEARAKSQKPFFLICAHLRESAANFAFDFAEVLL